jgi:hypothetical protein
VGLRGWGRRWRVGVRGGNKWGQFWSNSKKMKKKKKII